MSGRDQKKEKTPSTSGSDANANTQVVTRSAGKQGSNPMDLSPALIDKLVQTLESRFLCVIDRRIQQLEDCLPAKIDDVIDRRIQQLEDRLLAKIDDTMRPLMNRIAACEEVLAEVSKSKESLHGQIDDLRRTLRLNDVIMRGIPYQPNENALNVFKNIAAVIGHPVSTYTEAFRIRSKTSGHNNPIVVRFSSQVEQKVFLSAIRRRKGVQLAELEGFSSTSPIYINESLTTKNSFLLREAFKLRKLGKIHSARTKYGLVYIKTSDKGREVKIDNCDQLRNIDTDPNSVPNTT